MMAIGCSQTVFLARGATLHSLRTAAEPQASLLGGALLILPAWQGAEIGELIAHHSQVHSFPPHFNIWICDRTSVQMSAPNIRPRASLSASKCRNSLCVETPRCTAAFIKGVDRFAVRGWGARLERVTVDARRHTGCVDCH